MTETDGEGRDHEPCVLVIFGASGDLARRKLIPALFNLERDGSLCEYLTIVGYGRTPMAAEAFREKMAEAIQENRPGEIEAERLRAFLNRLHYVAGAYDDASDLARLHAFLDNLAPSGLSRRRLYYLALPPEVCEALLVSLSGMDRRVLRLGDDRAAAMIEKPFGRDAATARRLNDLLHGMFEERNIYRIDHYVAKETVRNLLVFRFGNAIFEPLWNRKYIDNVQITATETIGIEGRGAYYDGSGVVRDMVQNHVLQVLALTAMEPPAAGDAESVRDRKRDVFKALLPVREGDFGFGQYDGYRAERRVAPDSATPTFVAVKMAVNNWRWQGVPFYIRAGKALARRATEVTIQFKRVPVCVLENAEACAAIRPNVLSVRIQPDEGIRLTFSAKKPGREDFVSEANLDFRYADMGGRLGEAYERVLLDSLRGRPTLFWRADSIELAWQAVAPMLEPDAEAAAGPYPNYDVGSWGPAAAADLIARDGRQWIAPY